MPAKTLMHLAQNACIKNKRSLVDVGDFQYWKIKPVLESIESPSQLIIIETNSPQIRGEDAELWQRFIARDIPDWETKNYVPRNPLNWHKIYKKYKTEQQIKVRQDEETLRATLAGIKKEKDLHVSKLVDLKHLPKLPRDPKMIMNAGVPIKRGGFKKDTPSGLVWSAGSKTKLTDGKSVLTRARREAKEISQRGKLSMPTHQLAGRMGQIRKAPAGMVNEYRRAAEPPLRILAKRKNPVGQLPDNGPSLEEREKRLRALTSNRTYTTAQQETVISSTDEDDDSMDDLFDESRVAPQSKRMAPLPQRRPQSVAPTSRPISSSPASRPSSTILSKARPQPRSMGSSPMPSRGSSPAPFRKSPSPSHGDKRPMMKRKRPEVDVFNRKVKRPRPT